MSLLSQMIEKREAAQTDLDALLAVAEGESRDLTETEASDFEAKVTELRSLDERIESLSEVEARKAKAAEAAAAITATPTVKVTSEPTTYRKTMDKSAPSFMSDFIAAQRGNYEAAERLQRNNREARDMWEKRTGVTTVAGAGGEFAPPAWLVDQYISLARAGRPFADIVTNKPLPSGVSSLNIPAVTAGSSVGVQGTQNTAVSNTDPTTSSVAISIKTVAGYNLISQQELDQSPVNMDEVVLADLANAYAASLDAALITALAGTSGINAVTYTDASPTSLKVINQLGDAKQRVHTNRFAPATHFVMSPARWERFLVAADSSGRPLAPVGQTFNAYAGAEGNVAQGVAGSLLGLPVVLDPNIPSNLGAGTNQDEIFCVKADDTWLFESMPHLDTQPGPYANQLSVLVRFWRYYGIGQRYAKSVSLVTGTGMIPPTFGS